MVMGMDWITGPCKDRGLILSKHGAKIGLMTISRVFDVEKC